MKAIAIALTTMLIGGLAGQVEAHPGNDAHHRADEMGRHGKKKWRKKHRNMECCAKVGEKEIFEKVRAIVGYREVTEYKTETQMHMETRHRFVKKFRKETRYRDVTKHRMVTRYRYEWATRYVPGFRSQPVRFMAGTNRYGRPIYRTSYRRVSCYVPQSYQARVPYQVKEAYVVKEAYTVKVPYKVKEKFQVEVPVEVQVPITKRVPVYGFKKVAKTYPLYICTK